MTQELLSRIIYGFITSESLMLTVFFFGSSTIYLNNYVEFHFKYRNLLSYIIPFCILAGVLLTLIQCAMTLDSFILSSSFIMGICVVLWIEGNVAVWDFGSLDGSKINLINNEKRIIYDTLMCIAIVLFFVVMGRWIYRIYPYLLAILLILQCIDYAITLKKTPQNSDWLNYKLDPSKLFSLSKEKNIIVMVIDSFQSDIFKDIVEEDPEYRAIFEGFTYYSNCTGGYPTTYMEIPFILTGQYYTNTVASRQYIKKAFLEKSILGILKKQNFRVDIDTFVWQAVHMDPKIISNAERFTPWTSHIIKLGKLVMVKFAPLIIKKWFLADALESSPMHGIEFNYMSNIHEADAEQKVNCFKFYHTVGAHRPYILNENLEFEELPDDVRGYKSQAKGNLKQMKMFLDKLRELDIFDKSMIFVVGDHGAGITDSVITDNLASKFSPLMLFKKYNDHGNMKESRKPVSLLDITKTIAEIENLDNDYKGINILDPIDERRVRESFDYTWEESFWKTGYMPPLDKYLIQGFCWEEESWHNTHYQYRENGQRVYTFKPERYSYGEIINFSCNGNAVQYQVEGFSSPEDNFTWTSRSVARLKIPIPSTDNDILLTIKAFPFLPPNAQEGKNVVIIINNAKLADLVFKGSSEETIHVPNSLFKMGVLNIKLCIESTMSPLSCGMGDDSRKLGIAVSSITIFELNDNERG